MVKCENPSAEIYQLKSVADITRHVEKCGRTCYKSEVNITPESADKFITGILKSGHESVIEHANLIFTCPQSTRNEKALFDCLRLVRGLSVSDDTLADKPVFVVSGNMRTFRDIYKQTRINDFDGFFRKTTELKIFAQDLTNGHIGFEGLQFVGVQNSAYGDLHNYATVHLVCDIGFYKDVTRHRPCSFSIESTRYCNYSKDKFGNELVMLKPINLKEGTPEYAIWLDCMNQIEQHYMAMASLPDIKADQLRMMLPHSTKADVVMTCNFAEWKHIFSLRCAKQAHPSVRQGMLNVLGLLHTAYPQAFADIYKQYESDILLFRNNA